GVNYFIFRQFKVFYDINTVLTGAGGVAAHFQENIMRQIFSANGMIHVIAFLLPSLLYAMIGFRHDEAKPTDLSRKLFTLSLAVSFLLAGLLLIATDNIYKRVLHTEYDFQTAVADFGLMAALPMDLLNSSAPDTVTFTATPTPEPVQVPEETAVPEETPVPETVYADNVMDIDFDGRQGNATDEALDTYVQMQKPSKQNEMTGIFKGKNLIMITAEAFSGYIIDPVKTPTLYRLANNGIQFTDYYQQASAGTTGGEYQILFGNLPTSGGSSVPKMIGRNNYFTMGSQLNRLGYEGWAFHNNSADFYDRIHTHQHLGYSHGFMGYGTGMEEFVTWQWPQSDKEMFTGTFPMYCDEDRFNVYYMTVSGHNDYTFYGNAMSEKHKEETEDLPYSETVRAYYACNYELEEALTWLIGALAEKGLLDDTVICLAPDHFPYGLDREGYVGNLPYTDELYRFHITTTMERDTNRWILWCGALEDEEPIIVDAPTSSLDILPTLSNLFGLEWDSRLFPGRDVFSDAMPLVFNMNYDWRTELGTYVAYSGTFYPDEEDAEIPDGYVDAIRDIVADKITFCKGYNNTDYFGHLFDDSE
ncbi:MAG: LTA synthase family protein, partial [Solobacterium sp.]|nr:LTA synthase family protein [Solobacterium sp.]